MSDDHTRHLAAGARTLQAALDNWPAAEPRLRALAEAALAAPLPRTRQWLDASAVPSHGALMQRAFGLPPIETDRPLMYQGLP